MAHGHFLTWVDAEFGMSDQTARRFVHAAEAFGDKVNTVLNLPPTVLYALAAPSTPDEVRDNVVGLAGQGKKLETPLVDAARR